MSGEEVETEVVDVRMVHQIKKDEQFTVTTNLELKMKGTKQEEIDKLKEQLKKMEEDKVTMEGQMEALVGFIHFVHREMAKLVKYFVSLSKKNLEVANVLNLGPFEDEKELDTFLQLLQTLGKQFEGRFEWLGETKGLLKRVNGILEMAAGVMETNGSVDEVEVGGGDQEEVEDYMESSDFEEESVAAYQMDTLQELSSSLSPVATASMSQPMTPNKLKKNLKLKRAQMPHGIDLSNHTGFFCLCKKSFPNRTKRSLHIRYYTAKSSFQCPECPRRFKFMNLLRAHLKRNHHAKITVPYGETNCYKCGETFPSRKEFFEHLKVEHGGRNRNSLEESRFKLPSTSTCPTASTSKKASNQSTHPKPSVDYDGPHGIDKTSSIARCLCGKTYKHKKELRQHINARKYGKLFKCYMCPRPRGFYFLRSLKLHLKTTHKMKYLGGRYGCHICGDTFMQQGELQVHKKKVHHIRRKATKKPKQHDYGYQRVYTNKRKPVPESPSDHSEAPENEFVEQDEVDGILRPPQPEHISVPDNSEAPEDESVEDDEADEPPQLHPIYPEEDEEDDYEVAIQNVATTDLDNDNGYDSDVICLD